MKKFLMIVSVMMFSLTSFAQMGKTTVSGHFNYMLDSPNNCGLGANVGYEFAQNWRGVAQFDYYFRKDATSAWNVGVNAEYLFRIPNSSVIIYPLAGLNVLGWNHSETSDSKLGLNIGAGVEVPINSNIGFKAEYCYKTQGNGLSTINFGLVFPL